MEKICHLCQRRVPNATALMEHYRDDHARDDWSKKRVSGPQRSTSQTPSVDHGQQSWSPEPSGGDEHAKLGKQQFSQMHQRLRLPSTQDSSAAEQAPKPANESEAKVESWGACSLEPAAEPPPAPSETAAAAPPPSSDAFEQWVGRPLPIHRTKFLAGKIVEFKTAMTRLAMVSTIGGEENALIQLFEHWLNAQTIPPDRKRVCARNIGWLFHYQKAARSDFNVRRLTDFRRPDQLTFPSDLDELLPPGTRTNAIIEIALAHRQLLALLRAILRRDRQEGDVDHGTWRVADGQLGWKEAKSTSYYAEALRRNNLGDDQDAAAADTGDWLEELVAKADRDFVP